MDVNDLSEQPHLAVLQFAASRMGQQPNPNFSLDEATTAAEKAGYNVGTKRTSTKNGVLNSLTKLVGEGLVERVPGSASKKVQGYRARADALLKVLTWLEFVRRAKRVRGKDVVTWRGADRSDFLTRMGLDPKMHVWTNVHLVCDPKAPKDKVDALLADAGLRAAAEAAWETLERAVKAYNRRTGEPIPGHAVILQFNPARVVRVSFTASDERVETESRPSAAGQLRPRRAA